MASMIINKRGILSQIGKIGREMVRNHEVLRCKGNGLMFLLEEMQPPCVNKYVCRCYLFQEWDDSHDFMNLRVYEVMSASFDPTKSGLRHKVPADGVHTVSRDLYQCGCNQEFLRFRLDREDNEELIDAINHELYYIKSSKRQIVFPTDLFVEFDKPLIAWCPDLDQSELIMEQQGV